MQKILVVEDDQELSAGLCYALKEQGFQAVHAYTLAEAEQVLPASPDLVLLDVNLPDGEGFSLCRKIKEQGDIPVLFLTARDLEEDALRGYELGADDYVTKPFSVRVLLKKIELILRRADSVLTKVYDDGYLKIDFDAAKVITGGSECIVTPTEFRLLRMFTENPGQLLTYSLLLERVWDSQGQFVDKHTLAVNVNRLRSKIEKEQKKYISNVYGMGYQWLG